MPGQNRQASERAGVGSLQSWRETDYGVRKRRTTERAARHSVFQSATHCRKLRHRTSGAGSRKPEAGSRKPEAGSRKQEAGSGEEQAAGSESKSEGEAACARAAGKAPQS
jgi:hypothetical protein